MSTQPLLSPPTALALVAFLLLPACDQWALMVNSDGVLSISIFSDGFQPQDRFRVRARQADAALAGRLSGLCSEPQNGQRWPRSNPRRRV
jgi:hypothetical protein